MKTQISNPINGRDYIVRDMRNEKYLGKVQFGQIVGSSFAERTAVAEKVFAENPENLNIDIRGIKLTLDKVASNSGKSQSYRADLTLDQFDIISDNCRYFNITKETEFSLVIDSYMTVSIHFNNNFLGIGEEFVTIL